MRKPKTQDLDQTIKDTFDAYKPAETPKDSKIVIAEGISALVTIAFLVGWIVSALMAIWSPHHVQWIITAVVLLLITTGRGYAAEKRAKERKARR